jgi:hypothetical protein
VLAKSVEGLVPAQGATDESGSGQQSDVEDDGNRGVSGEPTG